jgi:hypothetical protein
MTTGKNRSLSAVWSSGAAFVGEGCDLLKRRIMGRSRARSKNRVIIGWIWG